MPKKDKHGFTKVKRGSTATRKDIRKIKKEIKASRIKDPRKKNAHFEGPKKNSGMDKRKVKNQERRSI